MSTLKEKSQAILNEKVTKILPENIKKGIRVFDVDGTYEGDASSSMPMNIQKQKTYKFTYVDAIPEDLDLIKLTEDYNLIMTTDGGKCAIYCTSGFMIGHVVVDGSDTIGYFYMDENTINLLKTEAGEESVIIEGTTNRGWKRVLANDTWVIYDIDKPEPLVATVADIGCNGETMEVLDVSRFNWLYSSVIECTLISSGAKLFETEEDLQADETAKDDDLAIVYTQEFQNATADSKFSVAKFPSTVVLDSAVVVNVRGEFTSDDHTSSVSSYLTPTRFTASYRTDSGYVGIAYSSTDGINYTRTDSVGEIIDFGTEISFDNRYEEWNDATGKFIMPIVNVFNGLYQWTSKSSLKFANVITDITVDPTTKLITTTNEKQATPTMEKIIATLNGLGISKNFTFVLRDKETNKFYGTYLRTGWYYDLIYRTDLSKLFYVIYAGNGTYTGETPTKEMYEIDIETGEVLNTTTTVGTPLCTSTEDGYWYGVELNTTKYDIYNMTAEKEIRVGFSDGGNAPVGGDESGMVLPNSPVPAYFIAPTQFSITQPYELLPGKIALGSDGPVKGDDTFYDNLELTEIVASKTETLDYERGLYVVANQDLHNKGIVKSNLTGMERYTSGVCLQHTKKDESFIAKSGTTFTTASTIIYQSSVSNTSYTFEIYDNNLEKLLDVTVPSSKTWTVCYKGQQIMETPDHKYLYFIVQTSSTDVGVVKVDLENKTYTINTVNNVHMYYSNIDVTIDLYHNDFYWCGMFNNDGSADVIKLYKGTELLTEQSLEFDYGYSSGQPICTQIGSYVYFGRLGYKNYNEFIDNKLYVYNIDTGAVTSLIFPSSSGYLISGKEIIDGVETEVGYIQTNQSSAYKLQKVTPTAVVDVKTGITYRKHSVTPFNRVYSNGTDVKIVDSHGYAYDVATGNVKCIFSSNDDIPYYYDMFDTETDKKYFHFLNYDSDTSKAYTIDETTGQLFIYTMYNNLAFGNTSNNFLLKTHKDSYRYLLVADSAQQFENNNE